MFTDTPWHGTPPHTQRGVPIYLLDHLGAGRHAKVVSTRARDLMGDGDVYRADPPLTGDLSRVAEVRDVDFPSLLYDDSILHQH